MPGTGENVDRFEFWNRATPPMTSPAQRQRLARMLTMMTGARFFFLVVDEYDEPAAGPIEL
jgi:hypothetical protein